MVWSFTYTLDTETVTALKEDHFPSIGTSYLFIFGAYEHTLGFALPFKQSL